MHSTATPSSMSVGLPAAVCSPVLFTRAALLSLLVVGVWCRQKWRKDAGIDTVLANPPTELRRVLSAIVPEAFHKFDRFGLPAYWMKVTPHSNQPKPSSAHVTPTTHAVLHRWLVPSRIVCVVRPAQ